MEECIKCHRKLSGQQKKFCSRKCKNAYGNGVYQHYELQRQRGLRIKNLFIAERGGGCERCGYNRCTSALEFHHVIPSTKKFQLGIDKLGNIKLEKAVAEFAKCIILCANCHSEEHHSGVAQPG